MNIGPKDSPEAGGDLIEINGRHTMSATVWSRPAEIRVNIPVRQGRPNVFDMLKEKDD